MIVNGKYTDSWLLLLFTIAMVLIQPRQNLTMFKPLPSCCAYVVFFFGPVTLGELDVL